MRQILQLVKVVSFFDAEIVISTSYTRTNITQLFLINVKKENQFQKYMTENCGFDEKIML